MSEFNLQQAKKIITPDTAVFWFRRDLRLQDNAGLYHALKANSKVIPVFIFDTEILDDLDDKDDRRVEFIHQSLEEIQRQLRDIGSTLIVLHGSPVALYRQLSPAVVYANRDYEPTAQKRDEDVRVMLDKKGIPFHTYKDHVIFEKGEVTKDGGDPYTVFTPYSKKWKATLTPFYYKSYPAEKYTDHFKRVKSVSLPSLEDIGFEKTNASFPERVIRTSIIEKYKQQRDFPAIHGTTRLSVHLRFGTVSIRKLVQVALKKNETWLNELIWREFYSMILFHFPHVVSQAFKPAYNAIRWRNHEEEFQRWCDGQTGYPIVDAGMRELNETGFMHNRVRMITASFLTKDLLIDWRWGEAYFAKKLLDYDLASNNGGWQWAAGSGCDAAPYFRVFNPYLQTDKFDPDKKYIKKWVPEWGSENYPQPIVDHSMARDRVLKAYKTALNK